jgi:hypothetical protein
LAGVAEELYGKLIRISGGKTMSLWGRTTLTNRNYKITSVKTACFLPYIAVFGIKMGIIQLNRQNCRTISCSRSQKLRLPKSTLQISAM